MNAEQKQANENRIKALEKIRQRQQLVKQAISGVGDASGNEQDSSLKVAMERNARPAAELKRPKLTLTPEQQQLIEKNRQKALERLRLKQGVASGVLRDASQASLKQYQPAVPGAINGGPIVGAGFSAINPGVDKPTANYIRPSIHKADYIEYDFSTMQDTFGGFVSNKKVDKNGNPIEMTLTDWKNQQLEKRNMTLHDEDEDDLPPMDLHNAPKCYECGSVDLDKKMLEVFNCRVCKSCKEKHPEKYSLLTKTECKEDYFMTEPELADLGLFRRIVKENPHSGTFSRMQLFLRYQIEEYAFKKWGSSDNLDKEWLRREEMRKNRREKRFNNKLREMRKKLRAEELTRNLRAQRDKKHVHDWSFPERKKPADGEEVLENSFVKRCIDCGMEVEEILM
ncbi:hypothetical protein PMKS-002305 [Pichia membranifaciens]|uniref:XPA C-terminal domain-containing protein n=1 Tax=Pichia membranifaciens TaxID=4926 RepID=A0A1Q2YH26_9ASCO|nr:hypothetical protein PMKS-002305 [Pichia membranifaciens]